MKDVKPRVGIIGIGETPYYGRGKSPFTSKQLVLQAIEAACADAGIETAEIDGFASYANDQNDGPSLMVDLGTRELRWSSMVWGGGGGGAMGAIASGCAAIRTGMANIVLVHRTITQQQNGRMQDALRSSYGVADYYARNGILAPVQICALRANRLIHEGVSPRAFEAVARACYHHAQTNDRAQAHDRPLSAQMYSQSRRIVEPFGLFDCSRENDISVAVLLASADTCKAAKQAPAYILATAQGGAMGERWENDSPYSGAGLRQVASRLWDEAGLGPEAVDCAQIYDNFSAQVVSILIDHGFCNIATANDFFRFENLIADGGELPLNTSGGLIAEGNSHGLGLVNEAVRQLRGTSSNPVDGAEVCLCVGGAATPLVSTALFRSG